MPMSNSDLAEQSLILQVVIGFLYPFILLLGFYVILNGHYTPGGGFQGGSVLATLLVARYVVSPRDDINSEDLHRYQRVFLALILIAPVVVLFPGLLHSYPRFRPLYLTVMDLLIGIQVGFGVGVAVLRFAFFEGTGKTWRL
ncbi:multicomponent Na+:H+ antiporter subunit B [Alkalispirochaeta americana]|uniref:Multicomponent Na+:H+ antiporter subunit B n=2 Tax=Alkalispirochaeta americana TaxID=159291 RepID=A0A1N6QQQ2_9SPIO|nr:multicomponent Na+:H+ antiporter subunit B [Alkalispirochaeta americana]